MATTETIAARIKGGMSTRLTAMMTTDGMTATTTIGHGISTLIVPTIGTSEAASASVPFGTAHRPHDLRRRGASASVGALPGGAFLGFYGGPSRLRAGPPIGSMHSSLSFFTLFTVRLTA